MADQTIQVNLVTEEVVAVLQPSEQVVVARVEQTIAVQNLFGEQVISVNLLPAEVLQVPAVVAEGGPSLPPGLSPFLEMMAVLGEDVVLDCAQSLAFKIDCRSIPGMYVLTIVVANWPRDGVTEVWLLLTGVLAPGIGVNWPGTAGEQLSVKPGGNNEYLLRSWDGDNIYKINTGFYYA